MGLGKIVLARIVRFVVFFGVMVGLVAAVQILGISLPYWGYGGICLISFAISFAVSYLIRSSGRPQAPRPPPRRPPDRYREPRYDRRREPPRRDDYRDRGYDDRYEDHYDDHPPEDYCRYCNKPLDYDSDICPYCRRRN